MPIGPTTYCNFAKNNKEEVARVLTKNKQITV